MLNDTNNYDEMNQGIDRITQILQRQSTPTASSPMMSQASQLPVNILNALQSGSYAFGANHSGSNLAQDIQKYQTNQQDQEINQQKMLLSAYEAKLKMGDAQTKALDDKITMFTGNDPEGKALFLQALHSDPESIDPTNSFQVMTKLAGIKKQTGYESPDLLNQKKMQNLDVEAKQLGLQKTRAEIGKLNTEAAGGGGETPAALKLANEYQKARNSGDSARMQDIIMFTKSLSKGETINPDGSVVPISGAPETAGLLEAGKKRGDLAVKKEALLPQATSALQSTLSNSANVNDAISQAEKQSGSLTTGFTGSLTKSIPGTSSYDLARTVDTIKANIGFDKLSDMRANSPTGGALGQVSDFENKMLQSVVANLEQSQSKEQFDRNLAKVKKQYAVSMDNLKNAYKRDFGTTQGFEQMASGVKQPQTDLHPLDKYMK